MGLGMGRGVVPCPLQFVYTVDALSSQLGNTLINHFMYTDDLVIVSLSSVGFNSYLAFAQIMGSSLILKMRVVKILV